MGRIILKLQVKLLYIISFIIIYHYIHLTIMGDP